MKNSLPLSCIFAQMLLSSCTPQGQSDANQTTHAQNWNWQTILQEKLPLLGHRNWVVIADMNKALANADVTPVDHEQLIARLDNVSNLFEVVIIKTPLTKPYTSTFFELDCKYWDSDMQSLLNAKIADSHK